MRSTTTSSEETRLHPLTLSFASAALERRFWSERNRNTIGASRLALVLGAAIYAAFGLLDRSVIPDAADTAWFIRFGVVCPIMALCVAASFHRFGASRLTWFSSVASLSAGLGIITMIVMAAPPGSYLYYAGLLLVCSAIYSFFHLRFSLAVVLSWLLVLVYEMAALLAGTTGTILINNTFFLIGTNTVGMIGCYGTERVLRSAFLDRLMVERLAQQDSLTGLLNRRAFLARAEVEVARCRRQGRPVSAIMLDIDHFKRINDTHGHAAGDRVLQLVAATLRGQLRPTDPVCRYGGEEFLALLPDTDARDSFRIGDRLRCAILEASLGATPDPIEVTASVGTATLGPESVTSLEDLLRSADGALYGAKHAGRNVVVLAA